MSIGGKRSLEKLHEFVTRSLGFILHPGIEYDLQPGPTKDGDKQTIIVANVPGAYHFPTIDGEGGLIWWCLSTTDFTFDDIKRKDGIKPEHKGRFDVVAVRLLHSVLGEEHWDIIMSNLIALLRPGGWIQWADFDPLTPCIAAVKSESLDATVLRNVLVRYVDNMKTKEIGDTHRIPSTFASHGLESVETDFYPQTEEIEFTKVVVAGFIESLQEAEEMSEIDARDVRVKLDNEIEGCRPVLKYDLWCHVAQKPLQ